MCRCMLAHNDWKFVNVFVIDFHGFASCNCCALNLIHFFVLYFTNAYTKNHWFCQQLLETTHWSVQSMERVQWNSGNAHRCAESREASSSGLTKNDCGQCDCESYSDIVDLDLHTVLIVLFHVRVALCTCRALPRALQHQTSWTLMYYIIWHSSQPLVQ